MASRASNAQVALGTFSSPGATPFSGVVLDGKVVPLQTLAPFCAKEFALTGAESTLALFDHWATAYPALQSGVNVLCAGSSDAARAAVAVAMPMTALRVHPPVAPRQIFLSGAN